MAAERAKSADLHSSGPSSSAAIGAPAATGSTAKSTAYRGDSKSTGVDRGRLAEPIGSSGGTAVIALPGLWTLVWPGLPRLWLAGHWRGLATACVFSVMLNAALLATFDAFGGGGRWEIFALWAAAGVFWMISARNSHRWRLGIARLPKREECDRRFAAAQEAYLKGHWPEAESLLEQLLEARPEDLEGRLLLATLLRRMGRVADARNQLEDFAKRTGSERWSLEFDREWQALRRPPASGDGRSERAGEQTKPEHVDQPV